MARHRCKSTTIDSEAHAEPTNLHALEHLHNYLINPPKKDDDAGDFLSDVSEDNQETSPLLIIVILQQILKISQNIIGMPMNIFPMIDLLLGDFLFI